jgi:hypothetical protein
MLLTRGVIILIIIDVIDQHLAVSRSIDDFISAFDLMPVVKSKAILNYSSEWLLGSTVNVALHYSSSTARQIFHGCIDANVRWCTFKKLPGKLQKGLKVKITTPPISISCDLRSRNYKAVGPARL